MLQVVHLLSGHLIRTTSPAQTAGEVVQRDFAAADLKILP